MNNFNYFIGIDEVGRGPLAGPVTLCAVISFVGKVPEGFGVIKDSKKLSKKKRVGWFQKMKMVKNEKRIDFSIFSGTNNSIDKIGIVKTIQNCVDKCLEKLSPNLEETLIMLDGSLHAPKIYKHQETIIKGDEKEVLIAMASVAAKVSRDWYMIEMSKKFPNYGFEKHKGYGTKGHYLAIKKYGTSSLHRKTFLSA